MSEARTTSPLLCTKRLKVTEGTANESSVDGDVWLASTFLCMKPLPCPDHPSKDFKRPR